MEIFVKELLELGYTARHFDLELTYVANKPTAAFGFKKESDLDYKIKKGIFEIFFTHFPDGVKTSLIGYPKPALYPFLITIPNHLYLISNS